MLLPPPPPTPFPYTTLFRSGIQQQPAHQHLGLARPLGARGALQIVLQHAPGLLGPPGPGQRHPPKEARILDDAIRRSRLDGPAEPLRGRLGVPLGERPPSLTELPVGGALGRLLRRGGAESLDDTRRAG